MTLSSLPEAGIRLTVLLIVSGFLISPVFAAQKHAAPQEKTGLHSNPWAFGQSADRNSAIWVRGMAGGEISARAKPALPKKNAADTSKGINAALTRAGKKSATDVGLKMKNETSNWKVAPNQMGMGQDETIAREGRHVLGAYAGVNATDDFNITVGPELIIKDEQNVRESANASQPDTALGLGMNFKLDF